MLLLVLREGVRQRKLSGVAQTLGVTQTAISHSVARLRDIFEDELFIRRPHGVEPTARAIELAGIAETVIEMTDAMLVDPKAFDPATEDRTLCICALDYEVTLMSGAIDTLHREAPGIRLEIRSMGRDAAMSALDRGEADIWLGFPHQLPKTLESALLFEETYRVIIRADHPRITDGGEIDLDTYCAAHHVLVAPGGTSGGIVDKTLQQAGRARTSSVMTTGFLSAMDLVARTDLIATVPTRLAMTHAKTFQLKVCQPPISPRPFQVSAVWHRRSSGDGAVKWFVKRIAEVLT